MSKKWREYPDPSQCCGAVEVRSDSSLDDGMVEDGDQIRCNNCDRTGKVIVYDVDDVVLDWED